MNVESQQAASAANIGNMSAPPRSKVVVRAITLNEASQNRPWGTFAPDFPPCGLKLVRRVELDRLIRARIPRALAVARIERTRATDLNPELDTNHRRLLAAVVLLRADLDGRNAGFEAMRDASALPVEELQDALIAGVRSVDGRVLGLPAFGFFDNGANASQMGDPPAEADFARAVFIQCHRYGDLFLRDADPIAQLSGLPADLIGALEGEVS